MTEGAYKWTVSCPGTTRTGTSSLGRAEAEKEAIQERVRMARQYDIHTGHVTCHLTGPRGATWSLLSRPKRRGGIKTELKWVKVNHDKTEP